MSSRIASAFWESVSYTGSLFSGSECSYNKFDFRLSVESKNLVSKTCKYQEVTEVVAIVLVNYVSFIIGEAASVTNQLKSYIVQTIFSQLQRIKRSGKNWIEPNLICLAVTL